MDTLRIALLTSLLLVGGAVAAEPEVLICEGQTSSEIYRFQALFDARWRNAGDMIVTKKFKSGGGTFRRFPSTDIVFEVDRLNAIIFDSGNLRDDSSPYVRLIYQVDGRSNATLRHGKDFTFNMDPSVRFGNSSGMAVECQRVPLTADEAAGRKACFASFDFCLSFQARHRRWPTGSAKDLSEIKWGPDIK